MKNRETNIKKNGNTIPHETCLNLNTVRLWIPKEFSHIKLNANRHSVLKERTRNTHAVWFWLGIGTLTKTKYGVTHKEMVEDGIGENTKYTHIEQEVKIEKFNEREEIASSVSTKTKRTR